MRIFLFTICIVFSSHAFSIELANEKEIICAGLIMTAGESIADFHDLKVGTSAKKMSKKWLLRYKKNESDIQDKTKAAWPSNQNQIDIEILKSSEAQTDELMEFVDTLNKNNVSAVLYKVDNFLEKKYRLNKCPI